VRRSPRPESSQLRRYRFQYDECRGVFSRWGEPLWRRGHKRQCLGMDAESVGRLSLLVVLQFERRSIGDGDHVAPYHVLIAIKFLLRNRCTTSKGLYRVLRHGAADHNVVRIKVDLIQELDSDVFTADLPEYGLQQGHIGAVVLVHKDGKVYEVNFVILDRETVAVASLFPYRFVRLAAGRSPTRAACRAHRSRGSWLR
jgi:Domain of unknown function (DUF4926)